MSNRVYSTRVDAIRHEVVDPVEAYGVVRLLEGQAEAIAARCIVTEMRNGSPRYWCELDDDDFWAVVEEII